MRIFHFRSKSLFDFRQKQLKAYDGHNTEWKWEKVGR